MLLAERDRLQHRAVALRALRRGCRRRRRSGARWKASKARHDVGAVDVVAHLLAAIAVDRVRLAGHRALHQVGRGSRAAARRRAAGRSGSRRGSRRSACRSSARTPAPSDRRPPWRRRTASASSGRSTSRCRSRRGSGGPRGSSRRVSVSISGSWFGQVAVDLVGGGEDERRVRGMAARGLQQVERSVGVDARSRCAGPAPPSRARAARRCGRSARATSRSPAKTPLDAVRVADVERRASESRRSVRRARSLTARVEASGPKN